MSPYSTTNHTTIQLSDLPSRASQSLYSRLAARVADFTQQQYRTQNEVDTHLRRYQARYPEHFGIWRIRSITVDDHYTVTVKLYSAVSCSRKEFAFGGAR